MYTYGVKCFYSLGGLFSLEYAVRVQGPEVTGNYLFLCVVIVLIFIVS